MARLGVVDFTEADETGGHDWSYLDVALYSCVGPALHVGDGQFDFVVDCRVEVPDPQFKELLRAWKPKSEIPAHLTVFEFNCRGLSLHEPFMLRVGLYGRRSFSCREPLLLWDGA